MPRVGKAKPAIREMQRGGVRRSSAGVPVAVAVPVRTPVEVEPEVVSVSRDVFCAGSKPTSAGHIVDGMPGNDVLKACRG
jgi:hypothetical protein